MGYGLWSIVYVAHRGSGYFSCNFFDTQFVRKFIFNQNYFRIGILEEKFARGEIDKTEFDTRRDKLEKRS